MNSILLVFYLLSLTKATTYTFGSSLINVQTVSSSPVINYLSHGDTCGQLQTRQFFLFHLSKANIMQSSSKWELAAYKNIINLGFHQILFMDINRIGGVMTIIFNSTVNTCAIYLSTQNVLYYNNSINYSQIPDQAFFTNGRIITLTIDEINNLTNIKSRLKSGVLVVQKNISRNYRNLQGDLNYNYILVWTQYTQITVFNVFDFTNLTFYAPPVHPAANSTSKIHFSFDQQLIVIETDHFNPIQIINMTSFQVVDSYYLNETIEQVYFMNNSYKFLIAYSPNDMIVIDLNVRSHYRIPKINSSSYTLDSNGSLFTCKNNLIEQHTIEIFHNISASNSISFTNTSVQDTQNVYSDGEEATLVLMNNSLVMVSSFAFLVSSGFNSIPVTGYFLSFLNYFSMSSLYVFLNMKIPHHLFTYLEFSYKSMNKDLLDLFGIQISIPPFSDEKVNNSKALEMQVSSDFIPSNTVIFIFVVINLAIIIGLQELSKYFSEKNWFRKKMKQYSKQLISFQFINMIAPIVLPWTFVILNMGVRNLRTKLSMACYIIIFFMVLVFPIYYFFDLLQDQSKRLRDKKKIKIVQNRKNRKMNEKRVRKIDKSKNEKKQQIKVYNFSSKNYETKYHLNQREQKVNKVRMKINYPENHQKNKNIVHDFKQERKIKIYEQQNKNNTSKQSSQPLHHDKISLRDLITTKILDQWYQCQINFLIPSLVLLDNPTYFLIIFFFFWLLGVFIASKNPKSGVIEKNNVALSIYPLIFHCCFMVFYWCKTPKILILTQLICFLVLLVGSFHHAITVILQLIVIANKILRFFFKKCKNNRVSHNKKVENTKDKPIEKLNKSIIKTGPTQYIPPLNKNNKNIRVKDHRTPKKDQLILHQLKQ